MKSMQLLFSLILSFLVVSSLSAEEKISVEETRELKASPQAVWALLGSYNALPRWLPGIASSKTLGSGQEVNDLRILSLEDGALVYEKLLAFDDDGMRVSYAIIDAPLPLSEYVAELSVSAGAEGGSKVVWKSTFVENGVTKDEAEKIIRGIYLAGLGNLEKMFGGKE